MHAYCRECQAQQEHLVNKGQKEDQDFLVVMLVHAITHTLLLIPLTQGPPGHPGVMGPPGDRGSQGAQVTVQANYDVTITSLCRVVWVLLVSVVLLETWDQLEMMEIGYELVY